MYCTCHMILVSLYAEIGVNVSLCNIDSQVCGGKHKWQGSFVRA